MSLIKLPLSLELILILTLLSQWTALLAPYPSVYARNLGFTSGVSILFTSPGQYIIKYRQFCLLNILSVHFFTLPVIILVQAIIFFLDSCNSLLNDPLFLLCDSQVFFAL